MLREAMLLAATLRESDLAGSTTVIFWYQALKGLPATCSKILALKLEVRTAAKSDGFKSGALVAEQQSPRARMLDQRPVRRVSQGHERNSSSSTGGGPMLHI